MSESTARRRPRYVALGSSFAAGPLIGRRAPGSPVAAGRSSLNYAHRLAARLDLDLVDVTFSGATAAGILDGGDPAQPPQIEAVTAGTTLVTVTCGGNDVAYVGRLTAASSPWPLRALPGIRQQVAEHGQDTEERFRTLTKTFDRLTEQVRERAPQAQLFLVDYLTLLPPAGQDTGRLPAEIADWGRKIAARLAAETRAAAERAGCGYIAASEASASHHAWSEHPWTRRYGISARGGAPFHPNAAGMQAVAELLSTALS